MNSMLYI